MQGEISRLCFDVCLNAPLSRVTVTVDVDLCAMY